MKSVFYTVSAVVLVGFLGFMLINYYSFIFSKKVNGEILEIERVTSPTAILGTVPSEQVFSFAVAIKQDDGEILTASTEDRQWAVAKKGMCVESRFYPYPPWDLKKSGTYANARLIRLKDCSNQQK